MALQFPQSPAINQEVNSGGTTWVWDGSKWTSKGLTSGLPIYPDENGDVLITGNLRINGDVVTSDLTLSGNADIAGNMNVAGNIDND